MPRIHIIILLALLTIVACGDQDADAPLTCTELMLTEGAPHLLTMQVTGVPEGAALVLYQGDELAYDTMISGSTVSAQVTDCMLAPSRLVVMQDERIIDECRTGWDTTQVTRADGTPGVCYLNRIIDAP